MADHDALSLDTLCIHAGQAPDPLSGAVMTPIVLSSTFAQDGPGAHKGFDYSRAGNPTRDALEACLAALEGAKHGIAFGSGCAATTAVLLGLEKGAHVLVGDDVYGGTFRIFDKVLKQFGLEATFMDMSDPAKVREAIRPTTRLVWMETPSNPLLKVFDIAALAEVARAKKIPLAVDNTFATPMLQRPLDLPSPFDCYMVLRGVKTLAVRVERHVASAGVLATWLEKHPQVEKVIYPGLESHPGHALVDKQMKGGGGMISVELKGGLAASTAFLKALRIFVCAESLGGVESLAEHPAIMTHASLPADVRKSLGIGDGLVRLSVGIEGVDDLRGDLERALAAAKTA